MQKKSSSKKDNKRKKLLSTLIPLGCLVIAAGITIPIVLTQCNNGPKLTVNRDRINTDNQDIVFTVRHAKNNNSISWSITPNVTSNPNDEGLSFVGEIGSTVANLSWDGSSAINATHTYTVITTVDGKQLSKSVTVDAYGSSYPTDAYHINSKMDTRYLVYNGTAIYFDDVFWAYYSHNTLFDLTFFRSEHPEITTNDFVIDGVVDFGVMIGFNESISLYGNTDSLIVSNEAVDYGLGITVATTTESEAADTYTGDIYIDKTVSFQIFDAVYPIGVNIDSSIATSSEITVNGKFELTATSATSYAVGVEFDSDCSGKLIVDGAFTINSEYLSWGVYIYGQIIGDVIINGTFILNALNEASGVVFYGEVKNDVTIDGTFSINSDDVAYGVQFSNEIVSSTQNINGVFDIRSTTSNTIGVLFVHTDTGSFQNINGTFSIDTSCSDATTIYALQFGGTIAGKTTINGYFAVNSLGYSGGVYFATNTTGEIDINGIFTLNAGEGDAQGVVFGGGVSDVTINGAFVLYRDSSSSYSNFGVSFGSEPESIEGTPSFYSNSIDWGEWITWGGTENWNGVECATGGETPTGDGTLALKSLYNNQNPEAYDYSIMIIENADTDIAAFNGPYKTKLNAYVLTLPDSSIGKVWLTSILNQTW